MGKLRPSDWTAINWYCKEFEYTCKDFIVWPIIRLRDKQNKIVDVNIANIKAKYEARPRKKSNKKISS